MVNYLAVVVAAVAGFLLGWGWYMAFGKAWKEALGRQEGDCKPTPLPFILAGLGSLLMAWMLAGLMGHLANVTVRGGLITAFFMWAGFVLTTTVVNQQFHGHEAPRDHHRRRALARRAPPHGGDHRGVWHLNG